MPQVEEMLAAVEGLRAERSAATTPHKPPHDARAHTAAA
jgi:hypothetical protein